jgi:hypothetical protein
MVKAFGDSSMAEKVETVSLSHQTVARRVAHMDEHVRSILCNVTEKVFNFLCVIKLMQANVSSLFVIFRVTFQRTRNC